MARCRRVALLIEWSRAYGRGVLRGIASYVRSRGPWEIFHTERRLCDGGPSWLEHWRGDGIIARMENPELVEQVRRLGLPTVNLFECTSALWMATIVTEEAVVGRLAADHLLERGLRHFAYCGISGIRSSDAREVAFCRRLAKAGFETAVFEDHADERSRFISGGEEHSLACEEAVIAWVKSLPKPVGLMGANDVLAHQIVVGCREHDIGVPDEVAVIGVDNDEMICELSQPPLSSVALNAERVGVEAASLLDRMMDGEPAGQEPIAVRPKGVVARSSTDVIAVADADVVAAVRFIREHACTGIHVADVVKHTRRSRSTLERRFARVLGRSPKAEINRVRLERVKQLLATTDYPLATIAEVSGFAYMEAMCWLFKRTFGETPGQYRQTAQTRRPVEQCG